MCLCEEQHTQPMNWAIKALVHKVAGYMLSVVHVQAILVHTCIKYSAHSLEVFEARVHQYCFQLD
jgi:hypothetical protein